MANWYYTRDGAILGPFSDEAMTELIDNGSVTFVTLVWDSDKKDEGKEWHYAYESPLASYFSVEIPTDELPSSSEIEKPPLPLELEQEPESEPEETPLDEAMPEPPAQPEPVQPEPIQQEPVQTEPEQVKSPAPETTATEKKPRTSLLLIPLFLLIFLVGLFIGMIFGYFMR